MAIHNKPIKTKNTRGIIYSKEIPDVRDGLTSLQRDVLAKVQNMTRNGKCKKIASVIEQFDVVPFNDVNDSYYLSHGYTGAFDTAAKIYDSILIMALKAKATPLLHGNGNFGVPSFAYTDFAAPGYNEIKLSDYAEVIFGIEQNCLKEGKGVFPTLIPNVLVSGTEGTLCNIPPHNLGEVIDAVIAMIQTPDMPEDRIFEYIQGPDYTTGGIILNKSELPEIYRTGVGNIQVRAKVTVEHDAEDNRDHLIISEIPFTLLSKCRGTEQSIYTGQSIHTDKTFMNVVLDEFPMWSGDFLKMENTSPDRETVRWDISLKKGANAERACEDLYHFSHFEGNYEYRAILESDGKPRLMSLRGILSKWIDYYRETLTDQNRGVPPTCNEMISLLQKIKERFATPRRTAIIDAM